MKAIAVVSVSFAEALAWVTWWNLNERAAFYYISKIPWRYEYTLQKSSPEYIHIIINVYIRHAENMKETNFCEKNRSMGHKNG